FRTSYGRANEGIARNNTDHMSYHIIDNTLSYRKVSGNHNFTALVGSVLQQYQWENNYIETRGFANDVLTTTTARSIMLSAGNSIAQKARASFLGSVTYDFDGRYLLTASFRVEGSSSSRPSHRWGYFPSFSLGWRLPEEHFMESIRPPVNDLKLRFG